MASKQVTDRQKSASSVVASGEANAEVIGQAVTSFLQPFVKKGQQVPDVGLLVHLLCAALEGSSHKVIAADAAHEAELGDDGAVRTARDNAHNALRDELIELREIVVGAYGPQAAAGIFKGATPDDPVVLSRFAGEVVDNLQKNKLPPPRIKGAKLDVAEVAASLSEKRDLLDKHLKSVQREVREAQKTLTDRNNAVAAHDAMFSGIATALSGLLLIAGKPELAARVKPSTRRPGETAEEAGDNPEATAPASPTET
ncbi:MAG: hypothetical protein IPK82_30035 [Polyangiaceae bacterium]|nr:hypothetical protein [Polyangiaceae bacterium]